MDIVQKAYFFFFRRDFLLKLFFSYQFNFHVVCLYYDYIDCCPFFFLIEICLSARYALENERIHFLSREQKINVLLIDLVQQADQYVLVF